MAKRAAETMRFNALQLRISHPGDIDQPPHPEDGVQEEAGKVDHPFIGVALQEGVHHHRRLFQVAGEVT